MVDPTAFGYGDLKFSWGDHICTIFENREQQMEVMVPFVTQGLVAGQRCVWASPKPAAELLRCRLAEVGADLPTLEASGQLLIISDMDYYLADGVFVPDRTLKLARTLYEDSIRDRYTGIRAAGDCSWAADDPVDPELWETYEREFGEEMAGKSAVVVCQYDKRRFSGTHLVAALRTHPIVILGKRVCRNPFFSTGDAVAVDERHVH
jgi:hypothetical protein